MLNNLLLRGANSPGITPSVAGFKPCKTTDCNTRKRHSKIAS